MTDAKASVAQGNEASVSTKDFYQTLGVEKTATESQIKNAYRKLALQYHPDRNAGNAEVAEKFKEISIAYAVLSDPNKRRQYDLGGHSGSIIDFEGIDVDQLGGIGRVFGALFTKIGVPIPTQISPKVLACAQDLAKSVGTAAARSSSPPDSLANGVGAESVVAKEFFPGSIHAARVEKQEPHFYWLNITESDIERGILLTCKSPQMSKFKESIKRKSFTYADMFFIPFERLRLSEFIPLKFFAEDKDVPVHFHLLDTLEHSPNLRLSPGKHLFCVYGDNWFKILETERKLMNKKTEMANFQEEFVAAKKRFEAAMEKLQTDTKEIQECLQKREAAYDEFLDICAANQVYPNSCIVPESSAQNQGGLVKGLFSGVSNMFSSK